MPAYWNFMITPTGCLRDAGGVVAWETVVTAPETAAFPLPRYHRLTSAQVIERLDGLSLAELKKVRAYEMEHKNRKTLLAQLERRIQATR